MSLCFKHNSSALQLASLPNKTDILIQPTQHKPLRKWQLIAIVLLGVSLIPLGDTAGKLMLQQGVTPVFVTWSRFFIGAIIVLPFCRISYQQLPALFNPRLLIRGALFLGAISAIMLSIKTEPLANVFGAFFVGPMVSYFLAALLLKEPLNWVRSILLIVGFGGSLLVIKPSFGMSTGMLFAALAGCFYGGMLVANRWLTGVYAPRFILLSGLVLGAIVQLPLVVNEIPTFNTSLCLLVLLSAAASALGNLLILEGNRRLPASVFAPLVYTQLIAATLYGYLVFDSIPDAISLLGLLILLVSGFAAFFIPHPSQKDHNKR